MSEHRLTEGRVAQLASITEWRNVREYGEEGTPFSNGARKMALHVRAELRPLLALLAERDALAARLAKVEALAAEWQRELDTRAIRDPDARYCWTTAARELRAALAAPVPSHAQPDEAEETP